MLMLNLLLLLVAQLPSQQLCLGENPPSGDIAIIGLYFDSSVSYTFPMALSLFHGGVLKNDTSLGLKTPTSLSFIF